MTYHVVQEDGSKFGPATVEDLRKWLSEGRVGPATVVEDEQGVRKPLGELPGFSGPVSPPPVQPLTPPTQAPNYAAPVAPAKNTWVIAAVLGCGGLFVGFMVLAAILFPVFSQARTSAKRVVTITNARTLARATIFYASDNDELLPPVTTSAMAMKPYIQTYVVDDQAYTTANPAGGEFLGNKALACVDASKVDSNAMVGTVLFYESKEWPDKGRVVAWLDGHTKYVKDFAPERDVKGIRKK